MPKAIRNILKTILLFNMLKVITNYYSIDRRSFNIKGYSYGEV